MRLLINTASTLKGGGIQVAKSFIEECKSISDHQYFVVLSEALATKVDTKIFPDNFSFYTAPFRPATKVFSFNSHNSFLRKIEENWKPDVVFTTSGPSYWRPKAPHVMGYNIPHYIYPESPYFKKISFKKKLWWIAMKSYAKYVFKRDAAALVVQTDDVNERVKKFLDVSNVYTVFNTINAHFINPVKIANKLPSKRGDEFRLLTLSAWYPHKNLSIITEINECLKSRDNNVKFVVTLPDEDFVKLTKGLHSNNIVNIGPVTIEEAPSLYKECDAMLLPTLLECFSASYVEAMKMQKPIITTNMGFARTICKDAALYFECTDAYDATNKILALKSSLKMQKELIEKGTLRLKIFGTPVERAKKYLEICESLLN